MQMREKSILVYDDFSFDNPCLLGTLFVNTIRGTENYSFEYSDFWLKETNYSVRIDPELPLVRGRIFPDSKSLFGLFADTSPDRWGRTLMNRRERIIAEKEKRRPRKRSPFRKAASRCKYPNGH